MLINKLVTFQAEFRKFSIQKLCVGASFIKSNLLGFLVHYNLQSIQEQLSALLPQKFNLNPEIS